MKVTQSWKHNPPSTISGYSITVTTVYSSFNKAEIDDLEQKMPKGMLIMGTDKPGQMYPLKEVTSSDQD